MAARWITVAEAAEIMGLTSRTARRSLLALAEEHPKLLDRSSARKYLVNRRELEKAFAPKPPEKTPEEKRLARLAREIAELERANRKLRAQLRELEALRASDEASAPPPDARAHAFTFGEPL